MPVSTLVEHLPSGESFTSPKDPRTEECISGQVWRKVLLIYGILSTSFPMQLNQLICSSTTCVIVCCLLACLRFATHLM